MQIFSIDFLGITIAPSYYGLMYAISFLLIFFLLERTKFFTKKDLDTFFLYIFFGVVFGGRLGYVFFYDFSYYLNNFLEIFMPWKGGMSFHGGLLGVIFSIFLFSRKYKKYDFLSITDLAARFTPIGLFFWRLGNFFNKELLGIPRYKGFFSVQKENISYFPTPLLEAFLEWIILFFLLFFFSRKQKTPGYISAFFLLGYSFFRFLAEFFRTPDIQIGYLFHTSWMTLGHVLSICMILGGLFLFFSRKWAVIDKNK